MKLKLSSLAKQIADCDAKKRYRTIGEALIRADKHPYTVRPYRCQVCNAWHLTHHIKEKR